MAGSTCRTVTLGLQRQRQAEAPEVVATGVDDSFGRNTSTFATGCSNVTFTFGEAGEISVRLLVFHTLTAFQRMRS